MSDPNRPVPFTQRISTGMSGTYMVEDQRFAARRPDVLIFQSEPLTEDITLVEPITASLHVSSTGTEADFIVKLIEVYTVDHAEPQPNPTQPETGHYQQLVRGEPFRPKPLGPGRVTRIEWVLPDICHTFRTGHRIMVQVQSSWFPFTHCNPQTFCNIYRARPEDYRPATQRIHRAGNIASSLRVLVAPR